MASSNRSPRNLLLDALPEDARARLAADLQPVTLTLGQVLHEPGAALRSAYFPTTSIISKLYDMEDGHSAQVALVGREGMVGVSLFLGAATPPIRASVQSAGQAFRLPAQRLQDEFARGGPTMQVLLRYTQSLMVQMMRTAACNRHGSLEQRLCRWLLLSLDRSTGDELAMTHDLIANALGVRREGVTEAAGRLQRRGAIRYLRGHIHVLDRAVLESHVCECYAKITQASIGCHAVGAPHDAVCQGAARRPIDRMSLTAH
jgi:CRP-like cAMP-binding protein